MRAKKIDANQNSIVARLRDIPGVSVAVTSSLGKGFPDLVIGFRGRNYLIELKDGSKNPSARKLTFQEEWFHDRWMGQVAKCSNFDEVAGVVGLPVKNRDRQKTND